MATAGPSTLPFIHYKLDITNGVRQLGVTADANGAQTNTGIADASFNANVSCIDTSNNPIYANDGCCTFEPSTSRFATMPSVLLNSANGYTFSVWVRIPSSQQTNTNTRIIYFGASSGSLFQLQTTQLDYPNNIRFECRFQAQPSSYTSSYSIYPDVWYHLSLTMSYSASNTSTWNMYVNGQLMATTTGNYYLESTTYTGNQIGNLFRGSVYDLRIFTSVLTASQINDIYQKSAYFNPIIQLRLNNNSTGLQNLGTLTKTPSGATFICDLSGSSVANLPTFTFGSPDSSFPTALQLNSASNQHVVLPSFATINNGLSFSTWFNLTQNTSQWVRIFDFGNGAANNNILVFFSISNKLGLSVYNNGNNDVLDVSANNLSLNTWYHFAWTMTYSASTTSLWKFYLNGNLVYTNSSVRYGTATTRTLNYLGRSNWGDPYVNIKLYDFQVYQNTISEAQVKKIYNFIPDSPTSSTLPYIHYKLDVTNGLSQLGITTDIYGAQTSTGIADASYNANVSCIDNSNNPIYANDGCCTFDPSQNKYITMPSIFLNSITGYTFSLWVRIPSINQTNTNSRILYFGAPSGSYVQIETTGLVYPNYLQFECKYQTQPSSLSPLYIIYPEVWYHFAWSLTYSTSNTSTWNMYMNGQLMGTTTGNYYPEYTTYTDTQIGNLFRGSVYDVRVLNNVLTAGQIYDIYQKSAYFNPIIQYKLNNNSTGLRNIGTLSKTTTGLAFNCDLSGSSVANLPTFTTGSPDANTPTSIFLDPSFNQFVSFPSFTTINNGLSFSMWLYLLENTLTPNNTYIFDIGSGAYTNNILMGFDGSQINSFNVQSLSNGGSYASVFPNLALNTWHHFTWTMTYSAGATSIWRIYLNGTLIYYSAARRYPTSVTRTLNTLAKNSFGTPYPRKFKLYDFQVYQNTLSEGQVKKLYNLASDTPIPSTLPHIHYKLDNANGLSQLGVTQTSYGVLANTGIADASYNANVSCLDASNNPIFTNDGCCFLDTSTSKYINLPSVVLNSTSGYTFSLWINLPNTSQVSAYSKIFQFRAANGSYVTISIYRPSQTNPYYIYAECNRQGSGVSTTNFYNIAPSYWAHITWSITYSTSNTSTYRMYMNGQLIGTNIGNYYPESTTYTSNQIGSNTAGFEFRGSVYDMRVFREVLLPSQISYLYANTSYFDPIIRYQLNNNTSGIQNLGTLSKTTSGLAFNCDLSGSSFENLPIFTSGSPDARFPTALQLNNSLNQHVVIPSFATINNGLSFSTWFNLTGLPTSAGDYRRLFDFSNGSGGNNDIVLAYSNTASLIVSVYNNPNFTDVFNLNANNLSLNTWYHCAWTMTYSASNTSLWKFYLNGNLVYTNSTARYAPALTRTRNYLGRGNYSPGGHPNIRLYDFQMFQNILSEGQVKRIYSLVADTITPSMLPYIHYKLDNANGLRQLGITADSNGALSNTGIADASYNANVTCLDSINNPIYANDGCCLFDPTQSKYVTMPSILLNSISGYTFSLWVRIPSINQSNTNSRIVYFGSSTGSYIQIQTTGIGLPNNIVFECRYRTMASSYSPAYTIYPDTWYHLAWSSTFSVSNTSTWNMYINGQLAGTTTGNYYPEPLTYTGNQIGNLFRGNVYDVRVFREVLLPSQISYLYTNSADFDPIIQLRLNNNSAGLQNIGTLTRTTTGAAFTCDLSGSSIANLPTFTSGSPDARFPTALRLDASFNQYVVVPSFATINNGLSFSTWFNLTATLPDLSRLFDFGATIGSNNNSIMINSNDINRFALSSFSDTGVQTSLSPTALSNLSLNTWYHIVWTITYSASNTSTWKIYLNGNLVDNSSTRTYPISITRTRNYLGRRNFGGGSYLPNIKLYDFRVYQNVLSDGQIRKIYNLT